MDVRDAHARRHEHGRERRRHPWIARLLALAARVAAAGVAAAVVLSTNGGHASHARKTPSRHHSGSSRAQTSTAQPTGKPGTAAIPVLAYNVINAAPPTSGASPDLYVPASE